MKRTALILTGLACLALLAAGCKNKEAYPKPKGTLRIVQYNVGAFSKEIDNSIPMIADMMKEIHADALSLNELDSCNTRHMNNQTADLAGRDPGPVHDRPSEGLGIRAQGLLRRRDPAVCPRIDPSGPPLQGSQPAPGTDHHRDPQSPLRGFRQAGFPRR